MANKFILVPEEIYKGLTTFDTGEPNLDLIRSDLEKIKRKKDTPSAKNVKYNQELRRYLQLRNEQQNRPVKVEMVATPKGAIMSTNSTRPSSNIVEDDDEIFTTDDISLPSYPQSTKDIKSIINFKPPTVSHRPSIVSSTSDKKHIKKLRESSPPPPPPPQPSTRNPRIIKKLEFKPKKKITRRKKKITSHKTAKYVDSDSTKQDSIVPLNDTSVIPQKVSKRILEQDETESIKRKRKDDKKSEPEIKQKDRRLKEVNKERSEKRQQLLTRRRKSQKQKIPIAPYVIQQIRNKEKKENPKSSKKVMREGRSPSPAIKRQKVKRKAELSDGDGHTISKLQRKVNKKQSQKASRLWVKNLKKRNVEFHPYKSKIKWATRKPTQKDIKNFKPSLW